MAIENSVQEQAVQWAVRTGDPEFVEWEAFTRWLESDPAHSAAYDQTQAAIADAMEAGLPAAPSDPARFGDEANVVPLTPHRFSRRGWISGAVAASLALAVALGIQFGPGASKVYETAPGEIRQIALADGSAITLGGGSRLRMAGPSAREAELEHGQALFSLTHDQGNPFEVSVGDDTLIDIGTVFDVRRSGGTTTVAVAEGAVLFNPDRQRVKVSPGQRLIRRDQQAKVEVSALPAELVGEWREGRLTFRDATLAELADDLTRASGLRFDAAPSTAERRISGSVLLAPVRADPASLGPLLGVSLRQRGDTWLIEP